jgi:hypothetical protein
LNQPKGNIMITTWKISQCDRLTETGFIQTAHWTVNAVDGDYTASSYGTCGFPVSTPSSPFEKVTEHDVLKWCWASGVDKDEVEASLAASIDSQKNPVVVAGLPWQ